MGHVGIQNSGPILGEHRIYVGGLGSMIFWSTHGCFHKMEVPLKGCGNIRSTF